MNCKLCNDSGQYRNVEGASRFCFCKLGRKAFEKAIFEPSAFAEMERPEQIAWLVRKRAEQYAAKNRRYYNKSLQHLCGLVSVALFTALKREGFSAQIAEGGAFGYHHVWILHRGKIIDATYTQFDINGPPVLFTRKADGRYQQTALHRKAKRLATTMSDPKWWQDVAFVADIGSGQSAALSGENT